MGPNSSEEINKSRVRSKEWWFGAVKRWTVMYKGNIIEVTRLEDKFYLNGEEIQYWDLIAKLESMGILAAAGVRRREGYRKLCVRCRLSYVDRVERCICGNQLRTTVRSKAGREERMGLSRIEAEPLEVLEK